MMKKKKKVLSLLCSAALMTGILAGCNSDSESVSKNGGDKKTTITLLMDTQSSREGYEAVSKIVEEKYNIVTEIETRPGGSEGDNIVKTRLATGDMADIFFYNSGSLMKALNPEQNMLDLSKEPFMDNVMDSFKDSVSVNYKVFGIPARFGSVGGWFYNKKVYAELGLSVPKTWEELMANNEKIKSAGKTAVIGAYKDTWTSQLIVLADNHNVLAEEPDFAEKYTANKAKFADTSAALRSFEKLEEVFKKGYMNKDALATSYDAGLKMLAEGTGAHLPMISFALANINQNHPDKINDIGVFAQPGDSAEKNGMTIWMPAGFYINKNSENTDDAKKWFEVFLSPEGTEAFLSKTNAEGPMLVKDAELPDNVFPAVKDMLPYFESGKTTPALEFLSPIKGPSLEQITTEVGSGITSAKEGAKLYDKDVEKQAKQLGIKGW